MNLLATKPALDAGVDLSDVLFAAGYDNAPRVRPGERFEHVFEERVDILAATDPGHLAIDSSEAKLTFGELDARANQLARFLKTQGFGSGDRVALLFDKSIFSYIATLAVLKLNAAYVPLDQSFPADRIAFIAEDAGCRAILSIARYREHLEPTGVTVLHLDDDLDAIDAQPTGRLTAFEKGEPKEDLAYIIYTSGTTGKPKGVPIDHAQIVNFIRVAAEVYGIRQDDRMYQGLTIAFDFAIEEIWVPLAVGATLVPGPTGARLLGKDLGDFLAEKNITALCCVPTLLATLEAELPQLRYIMVSGEACPQDLVARWQKPGRIFLNAYGPTEATVTATLTALEAGKPVTIGGPLPTYAIVMLDPDEARILKRGETGEIGIAGIGVARGYLNREELTQKVFIEDFLGIPGNESGRIYRTGDLGRINADGEIEYMGRIDTQVKIRGYRIELTEIESVLMKFPGIAQAVVNKYEPTPGAVELAAYYTVKPGVADFDLDAMVEELRQHVPAYMVPAYFERLEAMPLLPSHKADRKKLPAPQGPRYAVRKGAVVAPETDLEKAMAAALGAVLKLDEVSVEDHFFDDMGANSLLMAQFCTKLRETGLVADVSMRDTYMHPTIRQLAAHLQSARPAIDPADVEDILPVHKASTFAYVMTGIGQFGFALVYSLFSIWLMIEMLAFIFESQSPLDIYVRSVGVALAVTLAFTLVPIALKWLLVGRWKPDVFPVWSLKYYRFWLVRTVLALNPMAMFAGTPVYNFYLRLLGARIGRDAVLMSGSPVATDLLEVGDGAFVARSSFLSGYRVRSGYIEIGAVHIGARAYVGVASVLGVNTSIGDDAQLGNQSALYAGRSVPAGKRYHGSPAIETETDYRRVEPLPVSRLRQVLYVLLPILIGFLLGPVSTTALLSYFPEIAKLGADHLAGQDVIHQPLIVLAGWAFVFALVTYLVGLALGLASIYVMPRLLARFITPGRVYPLYGIHYFLLGWVRASSNSSTFNNIFGDSALITWFLQYVGWKLGTVKQTGSNFGSLQKHDVPFLTHVGSGTMVSDGLSVQNADFSATSFKVSETRIGDNNYLGNALYYPAGGRTGANVLIGTKTQVPIDGPIRENVGILGSPAFEIPRVVKRDTQFDHLATGEEFRRRLAAKTRSNIASMALYLLTRFIALYIGLLFFVVIISDPPLEVPLRLVFGGIAAFIVLSAYALLVEWWTLRFRRLRPATMSIYDPDFWRHERHWKVSDTAFTSIFAGTPLKGIMWRLVGVKVGKKLFDDGASASERSMVELGDYVTLGSGAILQGHTLEEGTFKSGPIKVGDECTVGANTFINYDATMLKGSELKQDSFLMKGEQMPAGSVWGGNPARQLRG